MPGPSSGRTRAERRVDVDQGLFEQPAADVRALVVMWGSTFSSRSSVNGMLEADRRSYEGWAQLIKKGQVEGSIRADLNPGAGAVVLLVVLMVMLAELA